MPALLQNSMDENRVRQRVCSLGKFNGIEQVIHLAPVPRLTQVLEHMDQPAVHQVIALCEEVRIDQLIPEIKIPCVFVAGNAVALQSITKPLEAPTLYSHLPWHLVVCSLIEKVLPQHPHLLPYVPQPTEEFIDLEVWALVL